MAKRESLSIIPPAAPTSTSSEPEKPEQARQKHLHANDAWPLPDSAVEIPPQSLRQVVKRKPVPSLSPERTGRRKVGRLSEVDNGSHEEGHRLSLTSQSANSRTDSVIAGGNEKPQKTTTGAKHVSAESVRASTDAQEQASECSQSESLQYHAFEDERRSQTSRLSLPPTDSRQSSPSRGLRPASSQPNLPRSLARSRPFSSYSNLRGRSLTPFGTYGSELGSQAPGSRAVSSTQRSSSRPRSYVGELNNVPYHQQIAPSGSLLHQKKSLSNIVGSGASLLDTKKTINMYRANIKKDTEASVQYEFAILMVNTARDANAEPDTDLNPSELINEAKHIIQRLADRGYPFAQYYLADGLSSGLFNKSPTPDHDKAFPHFLAASKHGHAEAAYRAALCYEFGWGTAKSHSKAYQFHRSAASKGHPGAATRLGLACIHGNMGLGRDRYREGIKWLKRAAESADTQYNSAPFELGLLHLTGAGDDVFKDEAYAAQLFTQAAELGHAQAGFLMGQAYETRLYGCPRDVALSVHFYSGAASKGHAEAMMALCAWFLVGAEPVVEKDEGEAFAWALRAAESGLLKAEYAVAYFAEMGIGCRRDPLEANVWYVRAAEHGDERAKQRLQILRAAATGSSAASVGSKEGKRKKFMGLF